MARFAADTRLIAPWTNDRKKVIDAIRRVKTRDGTAIYDAIAAALPVSAQGKHKKQVMLLITDGQDTHSKVSRPKLAEAARAAEVVIYALVVDGEETVSGRDTSQLRQAAFPLARSAPSIRGARAVSVDADVVTVSGQGERQVLRRPRSR